MISFLPLLTIFPNRLMTVPLYANIQYITRPKIIQLQLNPASIFKSQHFGLRRQKFSGIQLVKNFVKKKMIKERCQKMRSSLSNILQSPGLYGYPLLAKHRPFQFCSTNMFYLTLRLQKRKFSNYRCLDSHFCLPIQSIIF